MVEEFYSSVDALNLVADASRKPANCFSAVLRLATDSSSICQSAQSFHACAAHALVPARHCMLWLDRHDQTSCMRF